MLFVVGNMIEPSYSNDDADTGTSVGTSVQPSFLSDGFTVGVPSSGTYNGNLGTNETLRHLFLGTGKLVELLLVIVMVQLHLQLSANTDLDSVL